MVSALSLSVIVPTFNEQEGIEDCLLALLALDEPVDEIIVVDNNSSDDTRAIVRRIALQHRIIRLEHVREEGVINARSHGFDVAQGDLLARIDADTRVPPKWSAAIRAYFDDHGDTFAAGTGLCSCYDLPFQHRFRRSHAAVTERTVHALQTDDADAASASRLFGSNMAISRTAWLQVGSSRSHRIDIFEDLDLTLTLRAAHLPIGLIPHADAAISGRRYLSSPRSYLTYCLRDQRTFRVHGHHLRATVAVLLAVTVQVPFYLALWLPFRAYDPSTEKMHIRRLRARAPQRVLPSGTT